MIPKIIHQIWIGSNKKPKIWMKTFYKDYIKKYPDWTYVLWTEEEINKLKLINRNSYLDEPTYWGKADIIRYEVLYQFGGIYIDADSVWVNGKNLEECILKAKDTNLFFAKSHVPNQIANGVIGSSKHHPFFKELLTNLTPRYNRLKDKHVAVKIGPVYVTEMLKKYKATIFPAVYFFPSTWGKIEELDYHTKFNIPKESYMFQYGYSTNLTIGGNLHEIVNKTKDETDEDIIPKNIFV